MKFLVLGCNGMAGHIISIYLKERGYDVVGLARTTSEYVPTIVQDASDLRNLQKTLDEGEYDVVINALGLLNQFAEKNKEKAVFINSYLPHWLAAVTDGKSTRIFHMSTDCVFSGKTGPYTEKSFPDGTTFYDRSKALGELNDSKNLTFRNSIVGPDIKKSGIGLLNWFMQQPGPVVKGYAKAIWTGQTTLQLAKTMEMAALSDVKGLFNAVPNGNISKYELLKLFNKYLRNNSLTIEAVDGVNADKTLVRTNFELDYIIPEYETMVKEMSDWMQAHKSLYPHYNLD